jgi:thiol-disulfide isomerase/thioredoxin
MKKNLLLLVFVFAIFTGINAQTLVSTDIQKKNVVLEEFTGIHCPYCPEGHAIAQALKDENPSDVVLINIHTGGYAQPNAGEPDFRTDFGDAIAAQSGLDGYPSGQVNRHYFPDLASTNGPAMSRSAWGTAAGRMFAEDSPVNVGASTSYNSATRELTVNVELYYTADSPEATNFINVALLQSNILGPQSGGNMGNNYSHNHMLRDLITGQWGEEITTTSQGTFVEKTYTYTIPENFIDVECVVEDCEIAVFVAETQQEIYSGVVVPAIDGTTLVTATLTAPSELLMVGEATATSTFNAAVTNNLTIEEDYVLTLTKTDEVDGWVSSFKIDGTSYDETTTLSIAAATDVDFEINIIPSANSGIAKYSFSAKSVSNPNAPMVSFDVYVMANVTNLLINNQGTWTGGTPADLQQDYFDAFEFADMLNYTACDYKAFTLLGGNSKLGGIDNLYFNIAWTFPSFTDESVGYLSSFLDDGGNLFVAGQDAGWDTWDGTNGNGTEITQAFYTNYLHADYKNDGSTSNNSAYAYPEEEVFGSMANFTLTDIYGGNMYPDQIDALGDAVSIFKYNDSDSKSAAVRFENETYKIVYLGFDPSMAPQADMNEIIKRTDEYFNTGVGVNEIDENSVRIYPNPANDVLNIEAANSTISIFNTIGQLVFETKSDFQTTTVNTSDFETGTYIIKIANGANVVSKTLIVY